MDSLSPAWLLLAVLICSMIGRFMIIRAAWEISKPWGLAVLCVPLAPLVFRMKYKELAGEGQHWRTATTVLFLAFVGITGSTGSIDDFWDVVPQKWRPAQYAEHQEPVVSDEPSTASAAEEPEERDEEAAAVATAGQPAPAMASAQATPVLGHKGFMTRIATLVSPAAAQAATTPATPTIPATPAPPASAPPPPAQPVGGTPIATLMPPLKIAPTWSQRVATNQAEFARLGEVYETLKKEKGYLKKWDNEAINAYNAEAAKYQAALVAARAEQSELMKQSAVAKK